MKIKTLKLQEMLSKSIKGASNNKLIPITSLIGIKFENKKLTLTTTDSNNYLYVTDDTAQGEDMNVVVEVEKLARLVSKFTCDETEIIITDSYLEVKGNGVYKLEMPLDENGDAITYPDPYIKEKNEIDDTDSIEISSESIRKILTTVKPSIAVTLEEPCYTGYYVGESVVGTNREVATNYAVNLFNKNILMSGELMNLLEVISSEKIEVKITDKSIVFIAQDCIVYGKQMEGIEDFAIDTIKKFFDMGFDSMCNVSRDKLLQILDRLSLFVTDYDNQAITLHFTDNKLEISSVTDNAWEELKYIESENPKDFICKINVQYLINQVKAQESENVEIWYELNNAIRLNEGKITQIIALFA